MKFRGLIQAALIQILLFCAPPLAHAEDTPAPATQGCVLPAKRMERLELVFGLAGKPGRVASHAWDAFMEREVTPRFPDGLTVFDGYGQWRNKRGTISKESSRLLLIWYEKDATTETKIEAIRAAYKRRFHQDSVLRADEISCVSF
ncbi:DUF3574 domain-containing protein [Methyloferula stellata]|uniref:DUF3574 domain-containing protein n=1 Tax=Methyloferula stellata TaxID=876270 RepID=UPI00035F80DB|nr:DUF3574 domain-containing protein [Methyloferula stellata]